MIFFYKKKLNLSRAKDLQRINCSQLKADHPQQLELVIWYKKAFWFSLRNPFAKKKRKMHMTIQISFGGGVFFFCPAPMGGLCVQKCPFDTMQIGHFVLEREVKEITMVRPKVLFHDDDDDERLQRIACS